MHFRPLACPEASDLRHRQEEREKRKRCERETVTETERQLNMEVVVLYNLISKVTNRCFYIPFTQIIYSQSHRLTWVKSRRGPLKDMETRRWGL